MTTWTEEEYAAHLIKQKGGKAPVQASEGQAEAFALTPPADSQQRRRNQRLEQVEQQTYFDQINAAVELGKPGADMIFAIPNGTTANPTIGKMMVRGGVRKGVPDLAIMVPRDKFHGAFIEMKKACGVPSDIAPDQHKWMEKLSSVGYKTVVCFGWREALKFTAFYLGWDEN